ncbi:hypothetical protein AAG906_008190 [Vitis piasezkii]
MSRIKWRRCGKVPQAREATIKEMEIPHEDQSSHYDHEKDKFAYLSMRDRIELGKRQVQQSQWGSKYALNGDDSYKHTVGECPTIPTMRDMYGYQSSYTSSWNNHPNLATQPQPQPSMNKQSHGGLLGEQQNINSHLNEKIDNMESSINVRMERVYNDLSLRIEKVQDSIEKLTNLDIARGKRKLPPQPHHNLQGTNAKRSRKVQDDKGLQNPLKHPLLRKRRETNSLGPNGKDANFVWDPGGIQHEVGVQESIGSNGARFGVETKKLWPFEDDYAKLNTAAPHFATVGHVFGALYGAQIMHTISLFEA